MALRNLTFPSVTIETPGGPVAVRGLTPDMVLGLYMRHQGELSSLFETFVKRENGDVMTVAAGLMASAPGVMAELIALATGAHPGLSHIDPDTSVNPLALTDWERDIQVVRDHFSLPVQVAALEAIAKQTFSSDMPPGKFLAVVIQTAGSTTAALKPSLSLDGSGK